MNYPGKTAPSLCCGQHHLPHGAAVPSDASRRAAWVVFAIIPCIAGLPSHSHRQRLPDVPAHVLEERDRRISAPLEEPPLSASAVADTQTAPQEQIVLLSQGSLRRFGHKCDESAEMTSLEASVPVADPQVTLLANARQGTGIFEPSNEVADATMLDMFFQTGMGEAPEETANHDVQPLGTSTTRPTTADVTESSRALSAAAVVAPDFPENRGLGHGTLPTRPIQTTVPRLRERLSTSAGDSALELPLQPAFAAQNGTGGFPDGDSVAPLQALLFPQLPTIAKMDVTNIAGLGFGQAQHFDGAEKAVGNTKASVMHDAALQEGIAETAMRKFAEVLGEKVPAASVRPLFRNSGSSLVVLSAVASVLALSAVCLLVGFMLARHILQARGRVGPRVKVQALPLCTAAEIERHLPSSGCYDCAFSKPLSSRCLLRLQVLVEEPAAAAVLHAPLSGRPCVLFSAAASQRVHDGVHPAPIAYDSASIAFTVSLLHAPHVRVELRGEDVSLFDMSLGGFTIRQMLDAAPEHWRDFVVRHRTAAASRDEPGASSSWRKPASCPVFEFQECALLVGAVATVVGELHRGADGALSLRPLQGSTSDISRGATAFEPWRTSWEQPGCEIGTAMLADHINHAAAGTSIEATVEDAAAITDNILVSDDPELLSSAALCRGSILRDIGVYDTCFFKP